MCAHRQIHGSFACAKKTAEVMRLLITTQRHPDAASLIEDVRTVGTKLQAAKPVGERNPAPLDILSDRFPQQLEEFAAPPARLCCFVNQAQGCRVLIAVFGIAAELAIGNIVRRVLHMIREEQQQEQLTHSEGGTAATDAADQQQVRNTKQQAICT
jgi:hypothetical protein